MICTNLFIKPYKYYTILLGLFLCISCNYDCRKINRNELKSPYSQPKDSLKQQALIFLLENSRYHNSELSIFLNQFTYDTIDFRIDTISNSNVLKNLMIKHKVYPSSYLLEDTSFLTNEYIINNIDLAFETWNKYPWNKNIPKNIFFEYLLPYKVFGENAGNWRKELNSRYADLAIEKLTDDGEVHNANWLYYKIVSDEIGQSYKYNPSPLKLTKYTGFDELNAVKEVECYSGSYLGVYTLRALGIPATVDYIPMWGSYNGTHATEVFWDSDSLRFMTADGRGLSNRYPAKVFRYTFSAQKQWTDSIKPPIGQVPFLLDFIKHDHWKDVTKEHTATVDIEYILPQDEISTFAYICVFNYGKWVPLYWSIINDNKAIFRNMGVNVLYRIALPEEKGIRLTGNIICVDKLSNVSQRLPHSTIRQKMILHKLNTGSESWIEAGEEYTLYYWDKGLDWKLVASKICDADSIINFESVPVDTYYRLVKAKNSRNLERIFTYKNDEQVWW